MGVGNLKKELKKLDNNKLIEIVADLYIKNKSVKEFFDFYLKPNEQELFNTYRQKVFETFFPKRGNNFNFKQGIQFIRDFEKFGTSLDFVADLKLFYVEAGVQFTIEFGDVNTAFYKSLAVTFSESLKIMYTNDLLSKFEKE